LKSIAPVFTVGSVVDAVTWCDTPGCEPVFVNDPERTNKLCGTGKRRRHVAPGT